MNTRLQLVIGLYWLLVGTALRAQCPDQQAVYNQLELVSTSADAALRIRGLLQLEQHCLRCHQTADSIYAKVLHVLGRSYWKAGDLIKGEAYTKKAIVVNSILSDLTRKANLSNSYNNLGQILAEQNKYQQAFKAFDQSVLIARLYPDRYKVGATTLAKYANLLLLLGDYDKAVQRGQQGYELAKRAGESRLIVQNLVELSQALVKLRQYDKAKKAMAIALPIAQELKDPVELSNAFSVMGMLNEEAGLANDAVSYYKKAFSVNKQSNNRYGCAQTLSSLSHLYQTKQIDYSKALMFLQQALPYIDDTNDGALLLGDIGAVHRHQKEYDKGLGFYQRALLKFSINFKNPLNTSNPKAETIRLIRQKEYLLSLIQDKADTWLDYAKATGNNRQRLQYALDTYTVADQMIDFMRWEHTGQQSKLFWRDKTRGMYERAIETCYRLGDAEQVFRFLEKSRAVMLADKLNELGARQKLSRQQFEQEEQLQRAVSNQQSKLADIKPGDSTAYNSARMALLSKQDSLSRFLKNLEATNPAYYGYKYDNKTASLAELQRYLKKQSGSLITYFVGDSALYVLGVTGDTAMLRKQPVAGYKQTLNQFARMLATPEAMSKTTDVARFRMISNGLYKQLLGPLALPEGRVVVSPDGFFVPFDALSRSASQFDFAVNHYAFSYVYSASLLLKDGSMRARTLGYGRESFLGAAPVEFAPSLKQVILPRSDAALASIADRFSSPTLLTHKAATRRNFLTNAKTARIIHLFTHATADSTDQEPTLYFADSTLQLSDFSDNALPNAQLVVLAACKTGIGANQRGEGVFSLARGFAALGVPSVLTTLWSVQNEATYTLTDLFYKYIDEGLPKDIALQRAKQEWLKTAEGVNGLPNYWAGLIVVGDAEPLPRINSVLWGSVLLLLIAAAGLIFWHERPKRRITRPVSLPQPA